MIKNLALLFCITIIISCNSTQKLGLFDARTNQTKVTAHKIFILGSGTNATRLFLENITASLQKRFSKTGTESILVFSKKAEDINLNMYKKDGYDAIILFNARDSAVVNSGTNTNNYDIFPGQLSGAQFSLSLPSTEYKQKFFFSFYSNPEKPNLVYEGYLDLNFDFSISSKYEIIANKIFKKFKENKIEFK